MRQLLVLKKEFTIDHSIPVVNRKGDVQYTIKYVEESPDLGTFVISDRVNSEVSRIIYDLKTDTKDISVLIDDKCLFSLIQNNPLNKDYQIVDSSVELYGDWRTLDVDIVSGYRKVSKLRNRWISLGDALELTVFEEEYELVSLGVLVALEFINQENLTRIV